jgi:hypothetical protein
MWLVRTGRRRYGGLLDFLHGLSPIALEDVVDGRRRAAVAAGDCAQRFTLRVTRRNGIPFALRDFCHFFSLSGPWVR